MLTRHYFYHCVDKTRIKTLTVPIRMKLTLFRNQSRTRYVIGLAIEVVLKSPHNGVRLLAEMRCRRVRIVKLTIAFQDCALKRAHRCQQ